MKTLDERFDILEQKMRTESFRQSGTNSGFGYYIFDYDPRDELKVRRRVKDLVNSDTYEKFGYDLKEYDIYELMIQLLKDEDTYDDLRELEESDGTDYVFECISDTLFVKRERVHSSFSGIFPPIISGLLKIPQSVIMVICSGLVKFVFLFALPWQGAFFARTPSGSISQSGHE